MAKNLLKKIVLAGVPEQVNIPIQLCIEKGIFSKFGLSVEYVLVPEGTGAMIDMIERNQADIAITVTDASIVAKSKGRNIKLQGTWVESPLVWALAGSPNLNKDTVLQGASFFEDKMKKNGKIRFGVSRLGSGSYTMAYYTAMLYGIDIKAVDFVVANNFVGLRDGVANDKFDIFLWETFTTKPWFDRAELTKIGDVPTPWTAFSFISHSKTLTEDKNDSVKNQLFPALQEGYEVFLKEGNLNDNLPEILPPSIERIMAEYGHSEEDAKTWFKSCQYCKNPNMGLDLKQTENSVEILKKVGIVSEGFEAKWLWEDA